jgi:protein-S-isoprenylcysteine O-methyltransferase Ste14
VTKVFNSNLFDIFLNFLRKRRTLAFKIIFLLILAENILNGEKPHELWPPANTSIMAVIALFLILAGASIRFWARGHFVKGCLFTTGPYAMVRHPLYLGSFLIVLGVLFQLKERLFNWVIVLTAFAIFYSAAIIYEEKSLKRRFGKEWELYCAKVPAIFPSLRNWPSEKCTLKWNWSTYLATRESWATLCFLSLPFLIELIEDVVFKDMLGIK